MRSTFQKNLLGAANANFIHELNAKSLRDLNQHGAESEDVASKIQVAMERICPPQTTRKQKKTVNNKRKTPKHYNICVIEQRDRHVRQMHNFDRGNETGGVGWGEMMTTFK